jgi:hypothetical protein
VRASKDYYRRHPAIIAYLLILVSMFLGLLALGHNTDQNRHDACYSALETRLLLKDLISQSLGDTAAEETPQPTYPPEIQKLIDDSRKRTAEFRKFTDRVLSVSPGICDNTDLTEQKVKDDQIRKGQRQK